MTAVGALQTSSCGYGNAYSCPRLCENVHEPRTRSIVFSIVFPRWRPSVRSFFRLTEIEKDLLRAICEPRFSHSLAPKRSSNMALRNARVGGIADVTLSRSLDPARRHRERPAVRRRRAEYLGVVMRHAT